MIPRGNRAHGVAIAAAAHNIIGGSTPGERNIISGNSEDGMVIDEEAMYNIVIGNYIGTNANNTGFIRNQRSGIDISKEAQFNVVKQNVIAGNVDSGVSISDGTNNSILSNSIFSNGRLGIDLAPDGVTPNDPGDTDTGPNNLQNFPVLNSALARPGRLVVKGTLDTPNPRTVTIEFFANSEGDPSGHGEGETFLGTVNTNRKGKFTAPLPPVPVGTLISATATDGEGNTSEFAKNIVAQ